MVGTVSIWCGRNGNKLSVSVNHKRVWSNTAIACSAHNYFSPGNIFCFCSVFTTHFYMPPTIKKLVNQVEQEKDQNRALSTGSISYIRDTGILYNFFMAQNLPTSWIKEEDRTEQFLDALHFLSPNMA